MIVVAGAGYVIATEASKHRNKKYNHYEAIIRGGVYIGKGISKSQAIARMKSRKGIIITGIPIKELQKLMLSTEVLLNS
ncbi:hypothetical protein QLH48_10690 [Bacillus safensis]|uniref:hypothetical protein n=1 Tax=Bacillus TaxID=1386 RepID=UPI000F78ABA1|nr:MULTISPECIES: hypothetical protein [Bacillus]MCM3367913.1 hypothetical protein [Bacillus safensis]MDJ0290926.1 hypothetical protein [Bacillus safensis]NMW02482.1 hypothetical protein [Bacillus safensis]